MILDSLDNIDTYRTLHGGIYEGLRYLVTLDPSVELGEYEVSPSVRAIVSSYATKDQDEGRFEAHRHVIDVQYPIVGLERIEWSNLAGMERVTEYDPEKDRAFWIHPVRPASIVIGQGRFSVFFPDDAHNPALAAGASEVIRKVTLKVRLK